MLLNGKKRGKNMQKAKELRVYRPNLTLPELEFLISILKEKHARLAKVSDELGQRIKQLEERLDLINLWRKDKFGYSTIAKADFNALRKGLLKLKQKQFRLEEFRSIVAGYIQRFNSILEGKGKGRLSFWAEQARETIIVYRKVQLEES